MFNILYVDDDTTLLEIGKTFLERDSQFAVEAVTSAPKALELLHERPFDAIIADYMIPRMNGIGFLKQVRAFGYTLPFILFTGRGREEVVIEAINNGADFYLQKGGDPKSLFVELSHKIRQAVEKRRAEAALKESMNRLNLAQRLARMGDVTWDLLTDEVTLSDGACDLLQYDRQEKIDMRRLSQEIYHPEDFDRINQWLEECIATGGDTITPNEYRIVRKDNKVLTVHTTGLIQRVDDRPVKVFITLQDITERKEYENLLALLSQSLTDAMIMAKMAAWEYDIASEVFTFNDAFYAMHAMTVRDAGGYRMPASTFFEYYVTPAYRDEILATFRNALASTDPDYNETVEAELRRMDGTPFFVTAWFRIERDEEGRPVKLHGVNQNITERKRSEQAKETINRQLNLLISVTRHDIRNQLLSMRAFLEISKNSVGDPVKTLDYIGREEQVVAAIERQIAFTKEYQALGIKPPVWQHVASSIDAVVHGLDLGTVMLDVRGLENIEIIADPLLTKVFYNIIDNALRHGGEELTAITITTRTTAGGLHIVIEDNGTGIPDDEKENIFERGYGRNSGYGLFFVREILGITGITLQETGEAGRGARFEILVPIDAYRTCS